MQFCCLFCFMCPAVFVSTKNPTSPAILPVVRMGPLSRLPLVRSLIRSFQKVL